MLTVLQFSVLDISLNYSCNKEVFFKDDLFKFNKIEEGPGPNNGNDNEEGKQLLIFDIACSFDIWSR